MGEAAETFRRIDELLPERPGLRACDQALVRASAMLAAAFGCIALLGWILGLPILTSMGPGWIPMAPSTALFFLLYGTAVYICAGTSVGRGARQIGMALASAGALVALLLLVMSLFGIASKAEHLGIAISETSNGKPIGHMSPLAAVCFVLASSSLLAAFSPSSGRPWRVMAGFVFACLLVFASTVFVLAYLFGTPVLYTGKFIPPALTTSLAFAALGTGLWILAGSRVWTDGGRNDRIDAASLRASRTLVLVFTLVAAGLVSAGYLYFQYHEKDYRVQAEQQLSAIAELKLSELLEYREERRADGAFFYRNATFAALVRRAFDHKDDAQAEAGLREWLTKFSAHFQYDRIALLDRQGVVRMSAPEIPTPLSSVIVRRAAELLRSGEVGFQDFYRNEHDQRIRLAVLVPIFDPSDSRRALGTLALRIDPEAYLYPFMNRFEAMREAKMRNSVHVVEDGVEAMEFLRRQGRFGDAPRPDLILLDLNLPRRDGREVLADVKADPDLKRIPVVVLTTSQAEEDVVRAYNLHANCYVIKPVDLAQFMKIVAQIDEFWVKVVTLPRK